MLHGNFFNGSPCKPVFSGSVSIIAGARRGLKGTVAAMGGHLVSCPLAVSGRGSAPVFRFLQPENTSKQRREYNG
jgi:hypothetical protein